MELKHESLLYRTPMLFFLYPEAFSNKLRNETINNK